MDWPNWRGPQQNRASTEKNLVEKWDPAGGPGSNLLWRKKEYAGRCTPIVMRGKLYMIVHDQPDTPDEGEKVVCADAVTGKPIWEHRMNVYLSDVPADRAGWSSCVGDPDTGRIYAQSVCGYFCCLEGDSGKLIWDHSLHEEYGLISTFGGRTNFPLVFEDNVITSAVVVGWGDKPKWGRFALPAHRFMCFDKATGELRWISGTNISPYDTTFSTPTILPIGGRQQMIFCSGDGGVWSLQPRTGKPIWGYPFGRAGINISPLVTPEGRVFASQDCENTFGPGRGSVVALDGTESGDLTGKELWRKLEIMAGFSSPVMLNNRLYVVDNSAKLFIFDPETGHIIATKKLANTMRGTGVEGPTPLVADGKIYMVTGGGQWFVLKPTENSVRILDKIRLSNEFCDASPIVSHGRFYITTSEAMYCVGNRDQQPQADPLPPERKEAGNSDDKVATVQVVPFDVVLSPGEKQKYSVRLFNAAGQQVKKQPKAGEFEFSVDGPGDIGKNGLYEAPTDKKHQCALVRCVVDDVVGTARIRIVPPLPWKFDFDHVTDVPLTWLGGRVRWQVRGKEGDKYIAKKTVLPTPKDPNNKLGTRSYLWMGPISLSNYTIQADVLLKEHEVENGPSKMPEVGLIDSGYELLIRPARHILLLNSWLASDYRQYKNADFRPGADQWYTLKLSVIPEGDKATIRGKIWPRGQREPANWTVEMEDAKPNLHGTPGIYGLSSDAEIYLDNLQVTPN
ncbi:MAG TPA: PQQ-binding-like beta-propeller repeat protein [Lacipirellulaceae bacterium]|nr:PQQ-binding-like beta-propeller repeat protein [Lacipirellulaceae bacterium]